MNYTTIEQGKELEKILLPGSADMWYHGHGSPLKSERSYDDEPAAYHSRFPNWDIPCWSLSALYALLPERTNISKAYSDDCVTMVYWCWMIMSESEDECDTIIETDNYNNPIDACVEMILKLNELKML